MQSAIGARPEWRLQDRLRRSRDEAGLNQTQLAKEIGINPATISRYESGSLEPPLPVLIAWAFRCSVDLEWLRYGTEGGTHPKVTTTPNGSSSADTVDTGIYFHGTTSSHRPRAIRCNRAQRMRNVA